MVHCEAAVPPYDPRRMSAPLCPAPTLHLLRRQGACLLHDSEDVVLRRAGPTAAGGPCLH